MPWRPSPGNVIMTADGPRLIDWTFAIRAPAAFDHGSTHIDLSELALDVADDPRRPLAVNAAAQSAYTRLSGQPAAALRQAMETWLPIAIVRYFLLMGGPTSERWRRLMQRAKRPCARGTESEPYPALFAAPLGVLASAFTNGPRWSSSERPEAPSDHCVRSGSRSAPRAGPLRARPCRSRSSAKSLRTCPPRPSSSRRLGRPRPA